MNDLSENVDPQEIHKFKQLAARWWDPHGALKTLHDINPLRLDYVDQRAGLAGRDVIDVGCGGGILAEAMGQRAARVTAIDVADEPLTVARLHQAESGTNVTYIQSTPEALASQHKGSFDIVTCMELLEHVPDPSRVVKACAHLARPGGHLFFSTINRTPKAYLFAVIGAEYVLNMLPQGTHDYSRFIKPAELAAWCRANASHLVDITGLRYNPITRRYALGRDVDVNYFVHARRNGNGAS